MICLVLLLLAVASANAYDCLPNACDLVECTTVEAEQCLNGTVLTRGGFCDCCYFCVTIMDQDEECTPDDKMATSEPKLRCHNGLFCETTSSTCKPVPNKRAPKTCDLERQETEKKGHLEGQVYPICDDDGSYAAKQCRGVECYCVDPKGKYIENYSAHKVESDNMDCKCARDENDYKISGQTGRQFNCTELGNYPN